MADPRREGMLHAGVFAAALGLTLVAWWPVHAGWFLLDDYRWLPPAPRRFDVLKSLIGPWGHSLAYRPLMRLSFLLDLQLFGLDPRGWHLHSFVLHALDATLLFSLIRVTTGLWAPAAAIAALFVVSPASHENVAWISGRTFLLGALFFLLSANLLARAFLLGPRTHGNQGDDDGRRRTRLFVWGAIAYVAAMASYEPAVVLPLLAAAAVRIFPSPIAAPAEVSRRIRSLFLIAIAFFACRFVFLKGNLGGVNLTSPYWVYEPMRWWFDVWIRPGDTLRIAALAALAIAFIGSWLLLRLRPDLAPPPSAAPRLLVFLPIAACILFLPFINVIGIADRFLYLVQAVGIASIVLFLWLIARLSQAGAAFATLTVITLAIGGIVASRAAARDWAGAGAIARTVADELKRLHPAWPAGVDVVLDAVPRRVGRAPVYVLYTRESVLQRYATPAAHPADVDVYFGEELAAAPAHAEARRQRSTRRPARYFRFEAETQRLTELSAAEWESAHDARSRQ